MDRRVDAAGVSQLTSLLSAVFPIDYSGAQIDHLTVLIEAPTFPEIYELGLVPVGSTASAVITELFAQGI